MITLNFSVTVDDEDRDLLANVDIRILVTNAGKRPIPLSRMIAKRCLNAVLSSSELVDHIDRDSTNNIRSNLRIANHSQNAANTSRIAGSSGYRGVFLHHGKWQACVQWKGKKYRLGKFDNPVEAAIAYDRKAIDLHGEFAVTNFPREDYS